MEREIAVREVLATLKRHQEAGHHVDDRLLEQVNGPGKMFVMWLATADDFLSLVWQSTPDTLPLAPAGQPRTLRDCASRLARFGWQFEHLVQGGHSWFQSCAHLDAAFDYSKLGWVATTPLLKSEKCESPAGTFYVYDSSEEIVGRLGLG